MLAGTILSLIISNKTGAFSFHYTSHGRPAAVRCGGSLYQIWLTSWLTLHDLAYDLLFYIAGDPSGEATYNVN